MNFFKQDIEKDIKKEKILQEKVKKKLKLFKQKEQIKKEKFKKKEQLKKEKAFTKSIYDVMKVKGRFPFNIFSRIRKLKDRFWPQKTLLVNMELSNGLHKLFWVSIERNKFEFQKGTYIIDNELKYYNLGARTYCLDYHQELAFPVQRRIDVNQLKKIVTMEGITDVDTAINPLTLKQFIESEVIQKVMRGADMDKVFHFMKAMLVYVAIVTTILLLIYVQSSGILEGLRIPFLS